MRKSLGIVHMISFNIVDRQKVHENKLSIHHIEIVRNVTRVLKVGQPPFFPSIGACLVTARCVLSNMTSHSHIMVSTLDLHYQQEYEMFYYFCFQAIKKLFHPWNFHL